MTPQASTLAEGPCVAVVAVVLGIASALPGIVAADDSQPLDDEARGLIVAAISEALVETYVFEEKANEMAKFLAAEFKRGTYAQHESLKAFAEALTKDLRSVSHDLHLGVFVLPKDAPAGDTQEEQEERQRRSEEAARVDNYGFHRAEIMAGNVGYIDLRSFRDTGTAGPTAEAAMAFVAGTDALIFDLRHNGGGSPTMIQLISSYLFDEPVHLNSFYVRAGDQTLQFWTQKHVRGKKLVDIPVWVLTSQRTFSAAEEFTYNLKNLERATIVGETTRGGAHPVRARRFPELKLGVSVPFGRAINPITGTNWEGTGVEPDIKVPADEALDRAYLQALGELRDGAEGMQRKRVEAALAELRGDKSG